MKVIKNMVNMRDFDFARLMSAPNSEDITEWFSDSDIHLSDISISENIPYGRRCQDIVL